MTREEAIQVLNMVEAHGLADEAKRMAIESLSADTVSRSQYQGLLNAIGKVYVEVVRCKDCRHQPYCMEEGLKEFWAEPIEWCSRGERREE